MPLTLIQLISEQTMQNLLPVLRLKPARLVHLATPRTAARSAWIAEAVRQSNCPVELETLTLSAMPGMRETMRATLAAIEQAAARDETPLVNFTGGTKLMSIGAYVAALKHQTPSFYVDTQDAIFVDGQSADDLPALFKGDLSFTPIVRSLSLNAVAAANGCGRITNGHEWQPWLPLANHFLENPDDEEKCHAAINGTSGKPPAFPPPRKPAEWIAALDREILVPAVVAAVATTCGLFHAGTRAGSLRLPETSRDALTELAGLDGTGPVPGFTVRLFKAVAPLQFALNLLGGAWWEVIVAERMKQCGRFRDIRWSVQVGERGGPGLEEDIVALEGVQAVYVSCKRGGARSRLLPLLDEVNARAHSLGGAFTRCFLAVCIRPRGRVLANLEQRASELGIRLLFPDDLQSADPFA